MQKAALLQHIARAVPGLIALYRFGSQAQGTSRPESDIDLAVLAQQPLSPSARFALQEDLALLLRRDIDLVDLRQASTVFRMQVVSTGECLHSEDDRTREQFETVVYAAYARLNEERRDILDDIRPEAASMLDDVVLNKVASLERCVTRIREVYAGLDGNLYQNMTTQESILLNLQRTFELSIDLAMHMVRKRRLGVPQDSRDAFDLLQSNGHLDDALATAMKRMVEFRNVAIHEYDKRNLDIVKAIITQRLEDILTFGRRMLQQED
jgi:Uncharacterized conserved protein